MMNGDRRIPRTKGQVFFPFDDVIMVEGKLIKVEHDTRFII